MTPVWLVFCLLGTPPDAKLDSPVTIESASVDPEVTDPTAPSDQPDSSLIINWEVEQQAKIDFAEQGLFLLRKRREYGEYAQPTSTFTCRLAPTGQVVEEEQSRREMVERIPNEPDVLPEWQISHLPPGHWSLLVWLAYDGELPAVGNRCEIDVPANGEIKQTLQLTAIGTLVVTVDLQSVAHRLKQPPLLSISIYKPDGSQLTNRLKVISTTESLSYFDVIPVGEYEVTVNILSPEMHLTSSQHLTIRSGRLVFYDLRVEPSQKPDLDHLSIVARQPSLPGHFYLCSIFAL